MELLDECKELLRTKSSSYDNEISDLIEACIVDLKISGIKAYIEDPIIRRVIKIYVKANFGIENKDFERLMKSYDLLKIHLGLSGDYKDVEQGV